MSEKQEQIALFQRAELHPICRNYMRSDAAGGSRNLLEAISLKRQGLKAGFPDIGLYYPNGTYAGLFIELKTTTGKVSVKQTEWLNRLNSVGYKAIVCRGWEAAWREIEEYLG